MALGIKVKHGVVSLILPTPAPAVFKPFRGFPQKILNILFYTLRELLNFSFCFGYIEIIESRLNCINQLNCDLDTC